MSTVGILFTDPRARPLDNNGVPQSGCIASFYLTTTSAPAIVYADGACTVPMAGGGSMVSADTAGRFPAFYYDPSVTYRCVIRTAAGSLISDTDPVIGGRALFAPTALDLSSGLTIDDQYADGDVLRYKLIPNDPTKATANTAALKALVSWGTSNAGWGGNLKFTNTTGADIYYLNDIIDFRPGIYVDLCNSVLDFTKTSVASDAQSGFIHAKRDFSIGRGTIRVTGYTMFGGTTGGHPIMLGNRGTNSVYFSPLYDSLEPAPMGNIRIHDLYIDSTTVGGTGISSLGGLQNVVIENVVIKGNSALNMGIYSEFGWATSETNAWQRQTSHPHNWQVRNLVVNNLKPASNDGIAIEMNGAYGITVDGLRVNGAQGLVDFGAGESSFYRPWVGVDDIGSIVISANPGAASIPCGRYITLRNLTGRGITGSGIAAVGAQATTGAYLNWTANRSTYAIGDTVFNGANIYICTGTGTTAGSGGPTGIGAGITDNGVTWDFVELSAPHKTQLLNITLDGFTIDGVDGTGGNGISNYAGQFSARNGKITNFGTAVVQSDEATENVYESLDVLNSNLYGFRIGFASDQYAAARKSNTRILNCFVAGSGQGGSGSGQAIIANNTNGLLIEGNRFGYELIHDGFDDVTQSCAIDISASCHNVVCKNNYVAAVAGGAVAYAQVGAGSSQGCVIDGALGVVTTYSGSWEGVLQTANITLTCGTPGNLSVATSLAKYDYIQRGPKFSGSLELLTSAFTWTTASGNVILSGFPFTGATGLSTNPTGTLYFQGITKANYTQFSLVASATSSQLLIGCSGSGQAFATLQIGDMPSAGTVKLAGSIEVIVAPIT
jgi:hypothetical protein